MGIDLGGGGMRVRADGEMPLHARDDHSIRRTEGRIDIADVTARVARVVGSTVRAGTPVTVERVAIGLTGMPGHFTEQPALARMIADRFGARQVVIASDSLTTHIGSLSGRAGAVVAAGTGAIALGTDHDDRWAQADGWGYILGDHGGGAWIGARGLQLALLARDDRPGGSGALLDRAMARYGADDTLVGAVYNSPSPARELAQFAPEVAAAARDGDEQAAEIWRAAGQHLAEAAVSVCRTIPPVISWGGRLFDAGPLLLQPFAETVHVLRPDAEIVAPAGAAVDGALALAERPPRTGDNRYVRVFTF